MDITRILVILAAGIGGIAAGFGFQRSRQEPEVHAPPPVPSHPAIVLPRSTDSVEDLLKTEGAALEEKLPLWLLDASSADIGNLWSAWCERSLPEAWHANLLFARWLELDPNAATKASGIDGRPALAWARALRDPESTLAGIKGLPERDAVAAISALGDFHPETALKAFALNPELATPGAVRRVAMRLADGDPKGALNLMRLYQAGDLPAVMRVWTRNDPAAALEWLKAQPNDGPGDPYLDQFNDMLAATDTARLQSLAAKQPHGRIRREMEWAVFYKTLESDLNAAIVLARGNESPRIAAEWFAEVGRRQVAVDAEQAFKTLGEMLAACPEAMRIFDRVAGPNGFHSVDFEIRGVKDFTRSLLDRDPGRTLNVALATHGKFPGMQPNPWHGALGSLADTWTERDVNGFEKWLEAHPSGPVHDGGSGLLAWTHAHRRNFPEAIRWAQGIGNEEELGDRIDEVAQQWAQHDRKALAAWLKAADLPETLRSRIKQTLEEHPQ